MVRTPSCDKSGLRKGTWTPEEDRKLIAYVTRYGSWNWRQLPRFAGLARCGKSCRLRWMNYLRPNLKRGNFTKEEEECIIKLHAKLGNRWSAIAAQLPGRTDNEVKNHWHTSLKKRNPATSVEDNKSSTAAPEAPLSPISSSSSELSSSITSASNDDNNLAIQDFDDFAFLDGTLWTEPYLADILQTPSHHQALLPNGTFDEVSGAAQESSNSSRLIFDDASLIDLGNDFGSFLEEEAPMIESTFWNTQQLPQHVADDVSHVPSDLLMTSPSEYFSFSPLCGTDLWSATSDSFLYHHDHQPHLSLS